MTKHAPEQQINEPQPQPLVVYGDNVASTVTVDPEDAAQTMRELGISEETIAASAVYVDPKNRMLNNGTHYINRLGRLRFRSVPELQGVEGDIIRLSTKVRGQERTTEHMNKTATHEWEHVAQADRHDRKLTEGHIAIYGLAAIGALAGSRLGKSTKGKVGAVVGGFVGYQLGYWLAPHERQARVVSGQVRGVEPKAISRAVQRKIK